MMNIETTNFTAIKIINQSALTNSPVVTELSYLVAIVFKHSKGCKLPIHAKGHLSLKITAITTSVRSDV